MQAFIMCIVKPCQAFPFNKHKLSPASVLAHIVLLSNQFLENKRVPIKILFQPKLWVEGKAATFPDPHLMKDLRSGAQTL